MAITATAGAAPDVAPGVARKQILEVSIEVIAVFQRPIHMRISENGAAYLYSLLIALPFARGRASSGEKCTDFTIKTISIFQIGKMRGVEFRVSCARDLLGKKTPIGRWRRRIVRSRDH